jgi:hypothetical protein
MDEGKLGYGFTSADELEEVDIGPGDKPKANIYQQEVKSRITRGNDSTAERIYGLFCQGLHRDARVG